MFGKAITQIIRLSAIVQVLENAFNMCIALKLTNKIDLSQNMKQDLEDHIRTYKASLYIINKSSFKAAENLLYYFIVSRFVLAGYNCNLKNGLSNSQIIDEVLSDTQDMIKEFDMEFLKISKAILLFPGSEVDCNLLNRKKGFKATNIVSAMKQLERDNLGKFEEIRINSKGPISKLFHKLPVNDISFVHTRMLEQYKVSLNLFEQSFVTISCKIR
jgi:hypothetical protein